MKIFSCLHFSAHSSGFTILALVSQRHPKENGIAQGKLRYRIKFPTSSYLDPSSLITAAVKIVKRKTSNKLAPKVKSIPDSL